MTGKMERVCITWNGQGGELDSVIVKCEADDYRALTRALVELVSGNIVTPGDSFTVEKV